MGDVSALPAPRHSVKHFARWVASSCETGSLVLDIGAGVNATGSLEPITRQEPYLVGVDPHVSLHGNGCLDQRHQMSLEQFAAEHEATFDVAFAVYVLEHVADPAGFTAAVARVLRPGGEFFALTLNVRHYFGGTTWAMSRLHRAEWLLHRLKGSALGHEHHFPTEYRLNSIRAIQRHCAAAGFADLEFRCYDATRRYQWYLPPSVKWVAPAYTRMAYAVGSPALMGHLSFRAVR